MSNDPASVIGIRIRFRFLSSYLNFDIAIMLNSPSDIGRDQEGRGNALRSRRFASKRLAARSNEPLDFVSTSE